MKMLKALIGGILGLLIGAVLGLVGIAWWGIARSPSPPPGSGVGWDPISLMHDPALLSIVLFCAVASAYLFGRLFSRRGQGRPASHV